MFKKLMLASILFVGSVSEVKSMGIEPVSALVYPLDGQGMLSSFSKIDTIVSLWDDKIDGRYSGRAGLISFMILFTECFSDKSYEGKVRSLVNEYFIGGLTRTLIASGSLTAFLKFRNLTNISNEEKEKNEKVEKASSKMFKEALWRCPGQFLKIFSVFVAHRLIFDLIKK